MGVIISACGNSREQDSEADIKVESSQAEATESEREPESETTEEVKDEAKFENISEDELAIIDEKLNSREYSGFLDKGFDRLEDIDWKAVFYDGAGISTTEISEREKQALKKELHTEELYGDVTAISRQDMSDFILSHTGYETDAKELAVDGTYLEEFDKYYFIHFDTNYVPFKCLSGLKYGDLYQVTLQFDNSNEEDWANKPQRLLTFEDKNGVFELKSNIIDWSEDSDSEQSFEVDLGEDGKAWLYTYQGDNESGAHINIVKNGNLVDSTDTSRTWGDDGWIMNTVKAIGFVDYDIDGNNDMVVIGDTSNGEKILIYHHNTEDDADLYQNLYTINDELGKYVEKNIVSSTISEVRKCLMNEYESSAKDWKAAYKHIIRVFDIMGNKGEYKTEYNYDLLDIDGDSLKELIIDKTGYACSLYSYKDGHIICLMDSWGYGAMGNHGYEYVPGKNCLSNFNADFAGLIGKQYYMAIEEGKLVTPYWSVTYNFDDKNENGEPDDDEIEGNTFEDGVGKTLYYSDYPELSEDDVKRKIEELSSYTYEYLTGTKSKDEIYAIIDGSK